MPAPKGNKLWELRKISGRPLIYKKPINLWNACVAYFEWCDNNKIPEQKVFSNNGKCHVKTVKHIRAMTYQGLCVHLGISKKTWDLYRERDDFIPIVQQVENIMFEQKFSGAAAGMLNANIIARELGLADKQDNTISAPDGGPVQVQSITFNPVKPNG
ncbi:MAG: terminase small subunit [Nitrosomonadaceae bacterium]